MSKTAKRSSYPRLTDVEGVLIVSCQASSGEPLCAPEHIAALALSAVNGGCGALRLEGEVNIRAVRARTDLPIVGLTKVDGLSKEERLDCVYITPDFAAAESIVRAGADIVALDATRRKRPDGETLASLIKRIHDELKVPVWADIATLEEGVAAAQFGADVVSTTLYGYTKETALGPEDGPGLELLLRLKEKLSVPVVLEGRVWHVSEVARAFELGAYAVVVGSAITRPQLITERFVRAVPRVKSRA